MLLKYGYTLTNMGVLDLARRVLDLFSLKERKALVTGGSMGIGRGYALALAGAGADVAVVDINDKAGTSTVDELRSLGSDSFFVHCDVSDEPQIRDMMHAIMDRYGGLDIGVNNAGIYIEGEEENYRKEDWDRILDVNLTGIFLCAQAEARDMIERGQGGKIINTASMSGTIANGTAAYNASKAGVAHLTRSLAASWAKYNINVNSISPTYTLTPMNASTPKWLRDRIRELHPIGYIQRPEDLYGAAVFLASDASNYITGRDLIVDGGHTLNVWLEPPERKLAPRVSRDEEVLQLKHDLQVLGIEYDKDVVSFNDASQQTIGTKQDQ